MFGFIPLKFFEDSHRLYRNWKLMRFFSLLRDGVKMNDLFYSTEMLRFDKEMEYRSITGGIFSLGIIVAVLVGFASMIIDTLALNTINSVELTTKDSQPNPSNITLGQASNFMMAVEMWGVNTTAPVRYFDVLMIQLSTSNGQRDYNYSLIPFEACTPQHWAAFPNIAADFHRLSMSNWLCPPIGTVMEFNGDYTSNIYQYVNISVNPCIQFLNPYQPCASADELTTLFHKLDDSIRFKIYYTNPLINSGQKDYKSYYLETSNYISYGPTIGGQAYVYFSEYQITTDDSIWPYPSIDQDNGLLIQDKFAYHPYTTTMGPYAAYYLVKSPTNYVYQRQVQKISTVFSFIGGLVSAISAALFIFKAYNTLAFELTVAISIFKPPDDSGVDATNLNISFFTFFQYYLFQFCQKIGKPRQWPVVHYLCECREEIVKQLDVKALIKRVIFMQYCMTNLFEDYQLQGLQLQKPRNPNQIASIREKIESLDTYESHLFIGGSSKHSELSEEENESSSSFSQKKDAISSGKISTFPLKPGSKQKVELNGICELPSSDSSRINSPAPMINESAFRILSKNKVHPIDPINEGIKVDFEQIEIIKSKLNSRVSKEIRVSKADERRSINLSFLKKNAEEGNALSKKIWEQLEYFNAPGNKVRHSKFAG